MMCLLRSRLEIDRNVGALDEVKGLVAADDLDVFGELGLAELQSLQRLSLDLEPDAKLFERAEVLERVPAVDALEGVVGAVAEVEDVDGMLVDAAGDADHGSQALGVVDGAVGGVVHGDEDV